jgi:hypothetical protein
MKLETALKRILESDKSDEVKAMKLWILAAKQMPGSNAQRRVAEHWKNYYEKAQTQK